MKSYIGIAIAGLVFATQAQATTIINGNFETGPFGVAPTGFSVTPGAEILALQGSDYIPCCGVTGSPAQLANHFVSFGAGNIPNTSTLSQTFATIAGRSYRVNFDFGALGGGSQTIFANVFNADNSAQLGTFSATAIANNNLAATFSRYTLNFVAASNSTRLSFNVDPFTDNVDGILDNVTATIPEPETWAMMLIGFGFIGGVIRRHKSVTFAKV
jgi:hypothetical protein